MLLKATFETLYMVFVSSLCATLIGMVWGGFLVLTGMKVLWNKPWIYRILSVITDIGRSVPFAIVMIVCLPISRWIVHSSIGTSASIVPLTLAAIPFYGRVVENSLKNIALGTIETVKLLGANPFTIVMKVMIPEALPQLVSGFGLMMVNVVGYSAMAGIIGGGGLGKIAVQYGYQRWDTQLLVGATLILIVLVGMIQWATQKITEVILKQRC